MTEASGWRAAAVWSPQAGHGRRKKEKEREGARMIRVCHASIVLDDKLQSS